MKIVCSRWVGWNISEFKRVLSIFTVKWQRAHNRGWVEKKFPNIILNTTKMGNPRVKSHATYQIDFLRALKWGIVHLCTLNIFRDTINFRKMLPFYFLHFCKEIVKSPCKNAKNVKIQKNCHFMFLILSPIFLIYRDIHYLILTFLIPTLFFILISQGGV